MNERDSRIGEWRENEVNWNVKDQMELTVITVILLYYLNIITYFDDYLGLVHCVRNYAHIFQV